MNSLTRAILSWLIVVPLLHGTATAQAPPDCTRMDLERPVVGASLVVDALVGQAVFQSSEGSYPLGGIEGLCIAIVEPASRQVVVIGTTGDRGMFDIATPSAGQYLLIATHSDLGGIGAHVAVRPDSSTPGVRTGLLLRLSGDAKSYATQIRHLELRGELLRRLKVDQDVRNELIQAGMTSPDPLIQSRMQEIDASNTSRLLEVVAEFGWPAPELVGHDGAEAAFILLQHAEYAPQKQVFPLVEAAYHSSQASGQSFALLKDRILVREGKPQVYGTQARPTDEWIDGEPIFYEIEDRSSVDERRADVGLRPLAEYAAVMKDLYFPASESQEHRPD